MRRPALIMLLVLIVMRFCGVAAADLKLPQFFCDNMVLQQGIEVPIWGTANSGETVSAAIADLNRSTTADAAGHWLIRIGPLKAGGPYELKISAQTSIVLHNVLAGEVWVCSGQSNMEFPMRQVFNPDGEIAAANDPRLRLFGVNRAAADGPRPDVSGRWVECNSKSVKNFSAVAYYFGRELRKSLDEPVGLIEAAWGGTCIESWISSDALSSDPDYALMQSRWEKALKDYPQLLEDYHRDVQKWEKQAEAAKAAKQLAPRKPFHPLDGIENPADSPFMHDEKVFHGSVQHLSALYNGMIAPLLPYAIAGVIWYQGESNYTRGEQYRRLFPLLITDWRKQWKSPELPFLYVQLPYFGYALHSVSDKNGAKTFSGPPAEDWYSEVREAQRLALTAPRTAMATCIDNPEVDIHPRNKALFGLRLAIAAEAIVYGRDIPYRGPEFRSATVEGATVRVKFNPHGTLVSKSGEPLKGFAIAGSDKKFVWADAKISGDDVLVSSSAVPQPVAVRYGWNNSAEWNLCNSAGLPASPFRTDDWPLLSTGKR